MKFLNEAAFPETGLAYDQHQLPIALPRPLPPPHQHGDFFFAADERSEIALSRAASATTGSNKLEQRHRLRHSFQFMAAALFGDKKSGDLALHLGRHYDRAWLRQHLHSRRSIGGVAINLARRIDHYRAGCDTNARVERWLA